MKLRYTIPEFCELVGLSRSKCYERIRLGHIQVIKDGFQTFISHEEATRYASTPQPAAYPRREQQAV